MRLPGPEHTTSSVLLLTEDREPETADCVQDGRGPLINCGHGQVKEAILSTSLQPQVSTHRRRKATVARPAQTPPGPTAVRLLGTQPGEELRSLVQQKAPACPLIWFLFPASLCYLFSKENTESMI